MLRFVPNGESFGVASGVGKKGSIHLVKATESVTKVLFLPENVGGEFTTLAAALKKRGALAEVWTRYEHPFGYEVDKVLCRRDASILWQIIGRILGARYLFQSWDVVHFTFGSTLFDPGFSNLQGARAKKALLWTVKRILEGLSLLELFILRVRRVAVFVHFQGDDARQGKRRSNQSALSLVDVVPPGYYTKQSDAYKSRRIRKFLRAGAGIFVLNPDLFPLFSGEAVFVPYASVDPQKMNLSLPAKKRGTLRLAHAPSNRAVKGTSLIIEAVEELKERGLALELDLIEGVTNQEVIGRLGQCDVLIDQLYVGWYGAVAVEAMSQGKVCVAFIRESDLQYVPKDFAIDLPIVRSEPTDIKETLYWLVQMSKEDLSRMGLESRKFTERWHDPNQIAANLLDSYREKIRSMS